MPNTLADFDPAKFALYGYCADCDHNGVVPRLDESMTIPALIERLSCSTCESGNCSMVGLFKNSVCPAYSRPGRVYLCTWAGCSPDGVHD